MRSAATSLMMVMVACGLAACGDAGKSKDSLPIEAVEGNGGTPYPGPLDERLDERQRIDLRERGNLQR